MGFSQTGTIHTIFETNRVSERFTKREFVITVADNPKYPQVVMFQLTGDRCSQLDGLAVGDEVRVEFSLRGREWTSPKGEVKYFNSLDAWTVEATRIAERRPAQTGGGGGDPAPNYGGSDPDDSIPFCSSDITHDLGPLRGGRWP